MGQQQQQQDYHLGADPESARGPHHGGDVRVRATTERTYRDWPWALLFVVNLLLLAGVVAVSVPREKVDDSPFGGGGDSNNSTSTAPGDGDGEGNELSTSDTVKLAGVAVADFAAGLTLGGLWLWACMKFPRKLITGTMFFWGGLFIVAGLALLALGVFFAGIIYVIIGAFYFLMYYFWRSRIPFAATVLKAVAKTTRMFPGTFAFTFLALAVHIVWLGLWTIAIYQVVTKYEGGVGFALIVFCLLAYFWTVQVIYNTVHVTVSGTLATWYFMSGDEQMPSNPSVGAFKRAVTTSFGSICLGSLLVAALQTMRMVLRWLEGSRNGVLAILAFVARCLLGCVESLIRYFNAYAFVYCAVYGYDYIFAGKSVFRLIKQTGFEAVINDSLIGSVLSFGAFGAGMVVGVGSGGATYFLVEDYWLLMGIVGLLIGWSVCSLIMSVIDSGTKCMYVCFIENPDALRRNQPKLYEQFHVNYGSRLHVNWH